MEYRYLIFDFDGVLAESNDIRFRGFEDLFPDLSADVRARFLEFVKANGGLSRYGKIRHLYEDILGQPISEDRVNELAGRYSALVAGCVIAAAAVPGSLEFLREHADRFEYAVVSGSDQNELRQVCRARGIDGYFCAILGSPKEKTQNLIELMGSHGWDCQACVYVGDSLNDSDAAAEAGIDFVGRNSGLVDWASRGIVGIDDLHALPAAIAQLSDCRRPRADEAGRKDRV